MKIRGWTGLLFAIVMVSAVTAVMAEGATRVAGAVWADGELFDTIITPASFQMPPEGSTDVIYSFMMSGLEGQASVADASPGNPDYNGGRWDVHMAVFTEAGLEFFDPDGDGQTNLVLTSADEVHQYATMGYIAIHQANFYFECPLLPRHS
jgi:hypothetical protein